MQGDSDTLSAVLSNRIKPERDSSTSYQNTHQMAHQTWIDFLILSGLFSLSRAQKKAHHIFDPILFQVLTVISFLRPTLM